MRLVKRHTREYVESQVSKKKKSPISEASDIHVMVACELDAQTIKCAVENFTRSLTMCCKKNGAQEQKKSNYTQEIHICLALNFNLNSYGILTSKLAQT